MKKLFIFLLISTFVFAGLIIAGDKLPTTQSGRPYYDIYDENDMASDSDTGIPTQQSVKAYMDSGTATLAGKTLTAPKIVTTDGIMDAGGDEYLIFTEGTTPITYIGITAGNTGVDPQVRGAGETNTDILVAGTGTGNVYLADGTDITKDINFELGGATTAKTMTITSSHTDDRVLTLPDATDTLVGKDTTDTLTNKTLTSAVLNTGVSGTAVLDEDAMGTDSATQVATQQSIKAYVDSSVAPNTKFVNGEIADVSSAASTWTISPVTGTITNIWTVLEGAITVGDAAITFELAGTPITGGGITIANAASAAGDIDTATPSAANAVTAGDAIEIITDGGSTDAAKATVLFEVTPTATVLEKYVIAEIADISSAASSWTIAPVAGTIENIWTVIDGAIITVDAGITFELGGTAITGSAITIAFSGSAAGTIDTSAPSALNIVTQGQAIEIITDGASTNAVKAVVILEILPS